MLAKYEQVNYELLRPEQIRTLREKCPIVYIPTGSLGWHSWQNPLGTDALKAHAICCEAALRHAGVVLPPGIGGPNPLAYASPEMGRKIVEKMGNLIGLKARAMLTSSNAAGHSANALPLHERR